MKNSTFTSSTVRRAESDRVANVRLSDRQISEIAAVEVAEHESPLLDRALAWHAKQKSPYLSDLQKQFKLHPSVSGDGHYWSSDSDAEDVKAAIARHFAGKRFAGRCKRLREQYGLIRPSFAAQAKCSPAAFQIWEAEYLAYAMRNGLKDTSRMGYDSVGHWGASTTTIEKLWFLCGCKDSPKLRFLMGYELRRDAREVWSPSFIKKGHALQECRDILRGANWAAKRGFMSAYLLSSSQLRAIGRVSEPLRVALTTGFSFVESFGVSKNPGFYRTEGGEKLNYAFAAEVQTWHRERQAGILSPKHAHYFLGGNAEGWAAKQEAERIALDSSDIHDVLAECRRIVEACKGVIPVPPSHVIQLGSGVKVGCTYITVRHGREAQMNGETLGIALAILEAYSEMGIFSDAA